MSVEDDKINKLKRTTVKKAKLEKLDKKISIKNTRKSSNLETKRTSEKKYLDSLKKYFYNSELDDEFKLDREKSFLKRQATAKSSALKNKTSSMNNNTTSNVKLDKVGSNAVANATDQLDLDNETSNDSSALFNKKIILDVLIDITSTYKPKSVSKLSSLLNERGFNFSNHKIRNLLKRSNVQKVYDESGERYYKVLTEKKLTNNDKLIRDFVASINHNDAIIVVKTTIAGAPLVAKLIDFNSHDLDVLGTVAGDDTVIIIPRQVTNCHETFDKIHDFLLKN